MLINHEQYFTVVENIKNEIKNAQYRAAVSVNSELVMLYHTIGCIINQNKVWGNKFIDNLSADIKSAFPDSTGYSVRNLKYMAKFAAEYPDYNHGQDRVKGTENMVYQESHRKWMVQRCPCSSDRKRIV